MGNQLQLHCTWKRVIFMIKEGDKQDFGPSGLYRTYTTCTYMYMYSVHISAQGVILTLDMTRPFWR